jgi:hypothetical protein
VARTRQELRSSRQLQLICCDLVTGDEWRSLRVYLALLLLTIEPGLKVRAHPRGKRQLKGVLFTPPNHQKENSRGRRSVPRRSSSAPPAARALLETTIGPRRPVVTLRAAPEQLTLFRLQPLHRQPPASSSFRCVRAPPEKLRLGPPPAPACRPKLFRRFGRDGDVHRPARRLAPPNCSRPLEFHRPRGRPPSPRQR